ncbi:MAG: 3-methyladenine DNA glycosylase AlkD [Glaciecola sp.]|jgi:3-methyladenine DNA glycosylase AlkD
MKFSKQAEEIITSFTTAPPKLGDIKKLAKNIKKDHCLGIELWETKKHFPRLLAILIFDKAQLNEETILKLTDDIRSQNKEERYQLLEWLLANQLMKNKKLIKLLQSWDGHNSAMLRHLFWYHQARLRWTGQTPPDNSAQLLISLEAKLASEDPDVQWAMNFCAGQIGIFQEEYRARCIALGEKLALYKDEHVAKNCTPSYLPEFIRIQLEKK